MRITDPATMLQFMKAGNAYFTVQNRDTGNRVTYNMTADDDGSLTVRVFTGSDNSTRSHYSYIGTVNPQGRFVFASQINAVDGILEALGESPVGKDQWFLSFTQNIRRNLANGWKLSEKQQAQLDTLIRKYKIVSCPLTASDMKVKAFEWFWYKLTIPGRVLPEQFEFYHEGRCCVCARRLTVPESITDGVGPECRKNRTVLFVR